MILLSLKLVFFISPLIIEKDESAKLGLGVSNITPQLADQLSVETKEGVIVVDVNTGSKADKAGIEEDDIITEINHKPIHSVDVYHKMIKNINKGGSIKFLIKRRGSGLVVLILKK